MIYLEIVLVIFSILMLFGLVSKGDNKIVLWPEYFDSNLTKHSGRRVPQKLATSSPTVEDIARAAKRLKMNPKIERNKAYPNRWWRKSGRVLVMSQDSKTRVIRRVAIVMKKGTHKSQ